MSRKANDLYKAYDLYKEGSALLKKAGITDWEYDCRVLLEWTCGVSRMDLLLEPDKEIPEEQKNRFLSYLNKRALHEPLQYLIGEWEFMGMPFKVNPSVLIPRQDTEVLIEWILEREGKHCVETDEKQELKLLDVCTGSGCIAISLDSMLPARSGKRVNTEALDISKDALQTAMDNNILNQTHVNFIESNMFEKIDRTYDIMVSNPPYIPTEVVEGLMAEVVQFEPRIALDGMEDGLFFYRILAKDGRKHLSKGGRLYLEIGHDQGRTVPEILQKEGFSEIEVKKDFAGNDRCVRAVFPG
ncbi:MAG: peptide chain release factor N(5)-glutamine methyltransferase [Lachnospiraceae bacterium]|nr:peptide chain release factor N(5)-glutamine methyltransferase [Lachnospiraceae bacterium]